MNNNKNTSESRVYIDSVWVSRIKSPLWGLIVAVGPAATLFLGAAGAKKIIDDFRSAQHSLSAWLAVTVGSLCIICLAVSVSIAMDVYRSVMIQEKKRKKDANVPAHPSSQGSQGDR
jgi:uncharacterized membrane protein YhfC